MPPKKNTKKNTENNEKNTNYVTIQLGDGAKMVTVSDFDGNPIPTSMIGENISP